MTSLQLLSVLCLMHLHKISSFVVVFQRTTCNPRQCRQSSILHAVVDSNNDDDDESNDSTKTSWERISAELLMEDEDDGLKNDNDWLPDREKARQKRENARQYAEKVISSTKTKTTTKDSKGNDEVTTDRRPSPYTDEEEEVIAAMGGKQYNNGKREEGFLGDSTLHEIVTDYSVPICYIADVLCMWGVPIPININDKLGDLVTGEQAFALLEAINTLDISTLHDRYSNTSLEQLCYEWDINIQDAFEMCIKEQWNLPFGVQTCLRVEQEKELIRTLGVDGPYDISTLYDDDEE